MNHVQLEQRFKKIKEAKSSETCLYLEHFKNPVWIARRNPDNYYIVFILSKTGMTECYKNYGNLGFEVLLNCKIFLGKKRQTKNVALISLSDSSLTKSFFLFLESFFYIKDLSKFSDPANIQQYIEEWQELFTGESSLSFEEQVGLWGELFFINKFKNPARVIDKWHGPENKLFDFTSSNFLLDVKTSNQGTSHYFNLDQLRSIYPVYIYTIEVVEEPTGKSIENLITEIQKKIANKNVFFQKIAKTKILNNQPISTRFCTTQERFINGKHIPQTRSIDIGVEKVRFKSETANSKVETKNCVKKIISGLLR